MHETIIFLKIETDKEIIWLDLFEWVAKIK